MKNKIFLLLVEYLVVIISLIFFFKLATVFNGIARSIGLSEFELTGFDMITTILLIEFIEENIRKK